MYYDISMFVFRKCTHSNTNITFIILFGSFDNEKCPLLLPFCFWRMDVQEYACDFGKILQIQPTAKQIGKFWPINVYYKLNAIRVCASVGVFQHSGVGRKFE